MTTKAEAQQDDFIREALNRLGRFLSDPKPGKLASLNHLLQFYQQEVQTGNISVEDGTVVLLEPRF